MYIIDRFEGDWAIIEYKKRKTFNLPLSLIPPEAKEGDVIFISVKINADYTKKLRAKVNKIADSIFKD